VVEVGPQLLGGVVLEHSGGDLKACGAQPVEAASGYLGVGVTDGNHHMTDACRNDGIRTC
jgi:hypothetical protein